MKKLICKSLVFTLSCNGLALIGSVANADPVINAHKCVVENMKTGVKTDAVCGLKVDPDDHQVHPYRTFTIPGTQIIVEQFRIQVPGHPDRINEHRYVPKASSASNSGYAVPNRAYEAPRASNDNQSQSKSHLGTYLVIGGAVVGVATLGIVGSKMLSKRSKVRAEEAYNSGLKAGVKARPSALKDMPKKITLGNDVPSAKGKSVAVAGAVPSSSVAKNVPRFRTSSGDVYIIQRNPNNDLLETILLYDYLTTPYYYPGAYVYPSFGYSPYYYGPNETVIVNETIINNNAAPAYRTETYNTDVQPTQSAPVTDSFVETSSNYTQVSDTTVPATQTEWQSPPPADNTPAPSTSSSWFGSGSNDSAPSRSTSDDYNSSSSSSSSSSNDGWSSSSSSSSDSGSSYSSSDSSSSYDSGSSSSGSGDGW